MPRRAAGGQWGRSYLSTEGPLLESLSLLPRSSESESEELEDDELEFVTPPSSPPGSDEEAEEEEEDRLISPHAARAGRNKKAGVSSGGTSAAASTPAPAALSASSQDASASSRWMWHPTQRKALIAAQPRTQPDFATKVRSDPFLDGHIAAQCASGQLPNFLFYISRGTNVNLVVYSAKLTADGGSGSGSILEPAEPIMAFWHILVRKSLGWGSSELQPHATINLPTALQQDLFGGATGSGSVCLDGPALQEGLTFFERQAYAIEWWQDHERGGQWCFKLAAHPATTFTLEFITIAVPADTDSGGNGNGSHLQQRQQACACCVIEGEECYVEKVYVQTRAGFVVEYIQAYGTSKATGEPKTQKLNND